MSVLRCPKCTNVVGSQRQSGSWELRRQGRTVVVRPGGLEAITCEECGNVWSPEADGSGHPETVGRLAVPTVTRSAV